MNRPVEIDDVGALEAELLTVKLKEVVRSRREVSAKLSAASRKDRAEYLEQHRKIKKLEYALSDQLAEFKMSLALKAGNFAGVRAQEKRVKRLRSRLDHADWLLWTRSIWKFKEMESEAKKGEHPAQFSSRVPQRLIQMFSFVGDTVLDPFVGSGTTCVESMQLGRASVGLDINDNFLAVAKRRITEVVDDLKRKSVTPEVCSLYNCDARKMVDINDSSIQLVIAHPPYWNCVKISELKDDLSNCDNDSYPQFLDEMKLVLIECFRVLEADRIAAFMVGDITRKVGGTTRLFPFHSDLLRVAQDVGFIPWDVYIVETKMRNSGGMPMMGSYPYPHKIFAQFAHNYVLVLRKPIV